MVSKLQKLPLDYFKEAQIMSWFVQMCLGLKYIHERKILHRDIKPGNIFLHFLLGCDESIIKVGDLGLARMLDNTKVNKY